MKKFIILFVAATVIISAGCKKDLDVQDPNAPTTTIFWKSANDAQLGVNAIYSTFHRAGICRWFFFATMIRADEGWSTSPDANLQNNFDQFINNDYNYGNFTGIWNDLYVGIARCNQVLDNVPNINMDASLKARYLGEAKFLRALFYYHLASLWGNVPLQLKSSTPTDLPPTSPQNQVWAQVEKDLADAAASLPASYTGNDVGRATKGAANALMAKAYMQQHNYQAALQPLLAVIQSNVYSLRPNYQDNFLSTTEFNSESVFEYGNALNPNDNHDDDTQLSNQDNLNYGSSIPPFFAPRPIGFTDGQARRWLVTEFEKEKTAAGARDPRLGASLLFDSTDVRGPQFTMIYGQTFASRYGSTPNSDVWFRKFLNDNNGTATGDSFHSPNNYRFIRYADVLLMYAECLNETNSTATAYQYVDQVRARAGLAPLATVMPGMSHDQFLAQIKHERITELTGEGHRFNDLARWGDLGTNLATRDAGFSHFVKGKHELLPIPQQDLDINPNLKQNPGY
ncbi:RagB/SusD family nutrient uptake outer membrane protein [Mucilaginibacter sp. KACC 22063]|uniref:RagB/SusD family nutrient uptake outer membrane protein n=1 Tax=Mucilaginibacter sp. KACC 22063 TaxID=3025666 RepID=UPI0023673398|nr:RagB/SusD family nutrient uptake outer membrane protein [Mucilaginibacter sp. KACC 22063]WDF53983.1 RagB/SusD family nutrient uptake outer membrane protein [Mucilaginibacter sp. KACC 22063]